MFESKRDESFVLESIFFIHVSYDLNETPELQNKFVKQLKAVMGSKLHELAFFFVSQGMFVQKQNQ